MLSVYTYLLYTDDKRRLNYKGLVGNANRTNDSDEVVT